MPTLDHPAHQEPLALRLTDQRITDWLHLHYGIAMASAPDDATKAGVDHLMHGHLTSFIPGLVSQIMTDLRRAGVPV